MEDTGKKTRGGRGRGAARGRGRGKGRGRGRGRGKATAVVESEDEQLHEEMDESSCTNKSNDESPSPDKATIDEKSASPIIALNVVETNVEEIKVIESSGSVVPCEDEKEIDVRASVSTIDMEADISQLEAPTFTTISRGPPEPMTRLKWDHKVNLIGEKVLNPMIHCCDQCENVKPILIYGRMIPCKHVFCLKCGREEPIKSCPRCKEKVVRVEQSGLGTVFMCTHGGSRYGTTGCRRTYLSQRDLQAHINHRHVSLTATVEPKATEQTRVSTVSTRKPTSESTFTSLVRELNDSSSQPLLAATSNLDISSPAVILTGSRCTTNTVSLQGPAADTSVSSDIIQSFYSTNSKYANPLSGTFTLNNPNVGYFAASAASQAKSKNHSTNRSSGSYQPKTRTDNHYGMQSYPR